MDLIKQIVPQRFSYLANREFEQEVAARPAQHRKLFVMMRVRRLADRIEEGPPRRTYYSMSPQAREAAILVHAH